MKLINKFPRLDVDLTQLSQIWKEVSRKLDATWHFSRQKWAIFGQIQARGAGCAGVRGVMTESERIVLGEEGEGDSDDSDPVLVMGEASVGGSAGVSAGHSSFSHSTVAPGSSGPFGAPPAAPQAGGGAIRKPRADTVRTILRELGQKTLGTVEPTRQDIRDAVALMKRAVEQGQVRWAEKLGSSRRGSRNRTELIGSSLSGTTTALLLLPRISRTSSLPDRCVVQVRRL